MDIDWTKLAGTALQAGATIYSAKQNQKAIKSAQDAQVQAAQQAQAGIQSVLNQDPTKLPGYEFTRQQGEDAIMRNLRATGQSQSGAALKELQKYNTDLASQGYGQNFNRGINVAQLMGNYGVGAGQASSDAALMQGQNRNALIGGLADTFTSPGNMQSLKDLFASFYKQKAAPDPQDQYPGGYTGAR